MVVTRRVARERRQHTVRVGGTQHGAWWWHARVAHAPALVALTGTDMTYVPGSSRVQTRGRHVSWEGKRDSGGDELAHALTFFSCWRSPSRRSCRLSRLHRAHRAHRRGSWCFVPRTAPHIAPDRLIGSNPSWAPWDGTSDRTEERQTDTRLETVRREPRGQSTCREELCNFSVGEGSSYPFWLWHRFLMCVVRHPLQGTQAGAIKGPGARADERSFGRHPQQLVHDPGH